MEEKLDEIEIQEKIAEIVKKRHEQLSEIKLYYDLNNKQLYKDKVYLGENLQKFETIFNKKEYHIKCEDIISLTLSIGKVMDLNNSIKTILLCIKIFEEHKNYIKNKSNNTKNKTFIQNIFNKKMSIPLSQNCLIKERIKTVIDFDNINSYIKMKRFYESLFGTDSTFFEDLNNYYNYKDEKNLEDNNNNNKKEENKNKINKISYKFYNRMSFNFELDLSNTIYTACDIFYMLYNKMMDNICYNQNFLTYIEELDEYIINFFIQPCLNDLVKLSEYITKNKVNEHKNNLEK
jgi:hypothetical protein